MTSLKRLSDEEIQARLKGVSDWRIVDGKLRRQFEFDDFVHAFTFMTSLAFKAEAINHHPEWFNVYNRVVIDLRTHDCDGISDRDFELARKIDSLA